MLVNCQKFLILGISKSGYSACDYLLKNNSICYIYEELSSPSIKSRMEDLISRGAIFVTKEGIDEVLRYVDVLVISPGVPINHEIPVKAKSKNIKIISELEFGFNSLMPTIIGVTGTNGKTTTVSLIDAIIKESGKKSFAIGNIGCPVTQRVEEISSKSVCVTEISSFQLESTLNFRPDVACILNVSEDHLERHYSMENYIFLKRRLLTNLTESEYAVLNFDDEIVKSFEVGLKAKVIWVSTKEVVDGAYKKDGSLYYKNKEILSVSELKLKGEHNEQNTLFAIAVCKLLGVDDDTIRKALKNFNGVPHRIELICEKNGIKIYNDSKATNTASTISAIDCMSGATVLILGGSDKGEDYIKLFEKIKNSDIKQVVLTGDSKYKMLNSAKNVGIENLSMTGDFEQAVKIAYMFCESGCNLLLSPACASFDRFNGFEERGNFFKKIIGELN